MPNNAPIEHLKQIMVALRDPVTGCPWDAKQTFASVAPYTLEEAHEVLDAIHRNDLRDLREELGDLLLQVIFHSQIATEMGEFEFDDVVRGICEKMISRHPHVFAGASRESHSSETWEARKVQEKLKAGKAPSSSVLDGVLVALPALVRAQKLQKKAARVGFDWPSLEPVFDKIYEELEELKSEIKAQTSAHSALNELGDILFAVVNLGRKLGLDAEQALARTNARFTQRFQYIEKELARQNISFSQATLDQMEALWVEAKLAFKEKEAL